MNISLRRTLSARTKTICNKGISHFTVYSNQHQRATEIVNGATVRYDPNIVEYDPVIKAFLEKRWTLKEELPPKIYILEQISEIADSLNQQKLVFMKRLYGGERLEKMHTAEDINSQYIMSITGEEFFKPLLDEFVSKVLVCGRVAPLEKYQEYEDVREKCRKIYLRFFYGDPLSEYEKDIEMRYLAKKQQKYFRWLSSRRKEFICLWTYSNQKRIEQQKNWLARDLLYYDDFRPIYEPLKISSRLEHALQSMELNKDDWKRRFFFHLFEKKHYQRSTQKTLDALQMLIQRSELYVKCIEFTKTLDVPPDFHIEHALINLHVWLMIDRLRKINTVESRYMAKGMEQEFRRLTLEKANKIHLKKKNDFIKDVSHYMKNNRASYDRHFNTNPKTSINPYYKLDALIWSTVFFEKMERYNDLIYLVSEYLVKHYEYLAQLPYENFENAEIHWDVFRIPLDYKEKLAAINPPLSPQELEKEILSDAKVKKHYYTYDDPEHELPINKELDNVVNKRFNAVHMNIFRTIRKFNNLQSYDFYSEREEAEKEVEKKSQKYIWGTEKDHFRSPDDIKKILIQRRASKNAEEPK